MIVRSAGRIGAALGDLSTVVDKTVESLDSEQGYRHLSKRGRKQGRSEADRLSTTVDNPVERRRGGETKKPAGARGTAPGGAIRRTVWGKTGQTVAMRRGMMT